MNITREILSKPVRWNKILAPHQNAWGIEKFVKTEGTINCLYEVSARYFSLSNGLLKNYRLINNREIDIPRIRDKIISVETSIKYIQSKAYKETYGDDPVWKHYRRNFRGQFVPRLTRKMCIRVDMLQTGNPCPICRDEYLVPHYTNLELIKQFICPHTGKILEVRKTGVCLKQHEKIVVAIMIAKNRGMIEFDLHFRNYIYSDYPQWHQAHDQCDAGHTHAS